VTPATPLATPLGPSGRRSLTWSLSLPSGVDRRPANGHLSEPTFGGALRVEGRLPRLHRIALLGPALER
jgi:hypothetical protein